MPAWRAEKQCVSVRRVQNTGWSHLTWMSARLPGRELSTHVASSVEQHPPPPSWLPISRFHAATYPPHTQVNASYWN
ncbi:hypothetical protein DMENIID0001_157550 [Sergentomyia squamirostris]